MKKKLLYEDKPTGLVFCISLINGFLIFVCLVAILIFVFFASHSHFKILGSSMLPTIPSSGYACYIKNGAPFSYGNIVVANDPQVHTAPVVKRVIALGGDMIGFYYDHENYHLVLVQNQIGKILEEPYIGEAFFANNASAYNTFIGSNAIAPKLQNFEFMDTIIKVLPIEHDEVFLMGDNRKVSKDSTYYGAINTQFVQGRVDYIFPINTPAIKIALKDIFGF